MNWKDWRSLGDGRYRAPHSADKRGGSFAHQMWSNDFLLTRIPSRCGPINSKAARTSWLLRLSKNLFSFEFFFNLNWSTSTSTGLFSQGWGPHIQWHRLHVHLHLTFFHLSRVNLEFVHLFTIALKALSTLVKTSFTGTSLPPFLNSTFASSLTWMWDPRFQILSYGS